MSKEPERELARIISAEIGDVYNGMLGLVVHFEYESGMHQNLAGYMLDAAFVIRFVRAVGAGVLNECTGRSVWVTHTWDKILKVEPLHARDGKPFVIEEWSEWVKRRLPPMSYHELETGEETIR